MTSSQNNSSKHISLHNKFGLIVGVSNNRSIGWSIAESVLNAGSNIVITYKNPIWLKDLQILQSKYDDLHSSSHLHDTGRILAIYQYDVSDDKSIDNLCNHLIKHAENTQNISLDFLVYTPAYANKSTLCGDFFNISRQDFLESLSISCYGLNALINNLHTNFAPKASIIALSYYGSQKVVPNYDLMGISKAALESNVRYLAYYLGLKGTGIRANILSPGPIRTISSYGIAQFEKILTHAHKHSPIQANITLDQIARTALYLLSDLSTAITGSIHYVDNGQNTMFF